MSSKSKESIEFLTEEPVVETVEEVKETKEVEEKQVFDHYELHEAILWIQDILERGSINFVVLGDIAAQMYKYDNPSLMADKVEIAVLRKHFTQSGRSMISTWIPEALDLNLTDIRTEFKEVPIIITIVDEDPGYLGNPDKRFYYVTDLYLPNPMEAYLNDRNN